MAAEKAAALMEAKEKAPVTASERASESGVEEEEKRRIWPGEGGMLDDVIV